MYRDGFVYTSFTTGHDWGSHTTVCAVQYDKINVTTNTTTIDAVYGADDCYYYYPNIFVDAYGDIGLVFNRSSASEYVGVWWAFRASSDASMRASQQLRAGDGYYGWEDYARWGDYTGICLDPNKDNQLWFCGEYATSTNTIWSTWIGSFPFVAPVIFTNELKNVGSNLGGSFLVNSVLVSSGQTAAVPPQSNITATEQNERFSTRKHNNWNLVSSSYLLTYGFQSGVAYPLVPQSEVAWFDSLRPGTITASSIDGGSLSGVQLQFNDPWYLINSAGQQGNNGQATIPITQTSSPMTGAYNQGTGGVFTNQRYDVPGSPYYSVGFPSQTISVGGTNHALYFLNWTASGANIQNSTANQTGVEFTSSIATVTAKVKGNLLSSVSSATGYGNQSKIMQDYQGNLEMVYASGGEIWYTKSTNNGQTWSPEIRISAGDGSAMAPSIAQYWSTSGAYEVYVVWIDIGGGPWNRLRCLRQGFVGVYKFLGLDTSGDYQRNGTIDRKAVGNCRFVGERNNSHYCI